MRFRTEEFGMISPFEFIPLLEETGLIMPAGKWMLHRSLTICREFQSLMPDFHISINISYIQVMKSNIINEIISAVDMHGIDTSNVIIELTESGILESDSRVIKLVANLKNNGIRLALDDFGTGYSNFHYMVHSLNLKMCIEGIETNDELAKMSKLSPDYCQGYYWGKPCPYQEFQSLYIAQ